MSHPVCTLADDERQWPAWYPLFCTHVNNTAKLVNNPLFWQYKVRKSKTMHSLLSIQVTPPVTCTTSSAILQMQLIEMFMFPDCYVENV